jgi:hypothetical protein
MKRARSNDCESAFACGLGLVNPGDTKSVQDQFVVQTQLGWVEDGLPGSQDLEVLRYAPELVMVVALAILAGNLGRIPVAIKPRMRLSRRHGHSFPARLAEWSKWLHKLIDDAGAR